MAKDYSDKTAAQVDTFIRFAQTQRRQFERRWYDNNFFDDGYHFRYVSRTTGRIVDTQQRQIPGSPTRAIPKASRQIRGIANLILGLEPIPVIYPERINRNLYPAQETIDPATQQPMIIRPGYEEAKKVADIIAQKTGWWVEEEWKDQNLQQKLIYMAILTAKHSVSYLEVVPDHQEERIRMFVRDAFDVYVLGSVLDIQDSPMCVVSTPELLSKLQSDEMYSEEARARLFPDNKYASSEIKQAYMNTKLGKGVTSEDAQTIILNNAYIKTRLTDENEAEVRKDLKAGYKKKKKGDICIKQVHTAGGVTLFERYIDIPEYPLVDLRFEPGPLYQVPLIERFKDANRSLDVVMSRIEQFTNTMNIGVLMKRKGENFQLSNQAGAQVVEYETGRPEQMPVAGLPASTFNYINLLNENIEEQGASTSALGRLPDGVKSGVAIEAVKATEYANLKIPTDMLKLTVKKITERMLDIGANYFISPQDVKTLQDGTPVFYNIVGEAGLEAMKKINPNFTYDPEETIILKKDYAVDIQIESGLGYTEQGKRETVQQIANYMLQLSQAGIVPPEAIKSFIQNFLKTYKYGNTREFMEALDEGNTNNMLNEQQLLQIKTAVIEVFKDLMDQGVLPNPEQRIQEGKVATAETMKDFINGSNISAEGGQDAVTTGQEPTGGLV